jgi:hypothetical protein
LVKIGTKRQQVNGVAPNFGGGLNVLGIFRHGDARSGPSARVFNMQGEQLRHGVLRAEPRVA